jgi:hypothetical protein
MADDSSDGRVNRMLKHAAGMTAAAGTYKGLQVVWKQATGKEPPLGPDDQQAPLGRAIAWTLVMGAGITTARMIAMRYASRLLPGGQQQITTESAVAPIGDNPDSSKA